MRHFDYSQLESRTWDNDILSYIAQIHEYKGKQSASLSRKPVELDRLIEIAKNQSTEASNRIEGIVTTSPRMKQLLADKTAPRNRDEEEILGYRNVLNLIHESHDAIPVKPTYILQLHRDLLKFTPLSYGGTFKTTANEIDAMMPDGTKQILFKPVEPYETAESINELCETFDTAIKKQIVDPLILIPCFILDFLCIHPFNDGNGRMSRLLTTLLLYRSGFYVGKYVSLEAKIAKNKDLYYEALAAAQIGWHEGTEDVVPPIVISSQVDFAFISLHFMLLCLLTIL